MIKNKKTNRVIEYKELKSGNKIPTVMYNGKKYYLIDSSSDDVAVISRCSSGMCNRKEVSITDLGFFGTDR